MKREQVIIMYDSPEAAEIKTLTGWVGGNRYWGQDEHMARWAGCTHVKCECGHVHEKTWTMCPECRLKKAKERYDALPFKEWDGIEPVVDWDGDRYFFSIDDLNDYMVENEITEIDLLICSPVHYTPIRIDLWEGDTHEDWEPPKELQEKLNDINNYLKTLPAHSWMPGKIRTSYKLPPEDDK